MNSPQYTIAIRTDGSTAIGMGHISTCLALAESLKQYPEISFYFIMRNFKEAVDKVRSYGYVVQEIPIRLTEEQTVKSMLKILRDNKTNLMVTDLLEISLDFSQQLREQGIKSISVDILGKIKLQSDIIINRTFIKERYKNYNWNGRTRYFLGSEYVVLNKQYWGMEKLQREIKKKVKNILVCLGGGDEFNITTRVVNVLDSISDVQGTIILGAAFQGEQELKRTFKKVKNQFTVEKDVKNMSQHLLNTDIAICAGGLTLYELAITGTPALIIPMNGHQIENAQTFEKAGSVIGTDLYTMVTDEQIKEKIIILMNDNSKRKEMSIAGKKVTDGRGAERIAKIIYDHLRT